MLLLSLLLLLQLCNNLAQLISPSREQNVLDVCATNIKTKNMEFYQ